MENRCFVNIDWLFFIHFIGFTVSLHTFCWCNMPQCGIWFLVKTVCLFNSLSIVQVHSSPMQQTEEFNHRILLRLTLTSVITMVVGAVFLFIQRCFPALSPFPRQHIDTILRFYRKVMGFDKCEELRSSFWWWKHSFIRIIARQRVEGPGLVESLQPTHKRKFYSKICIPDNEQPDCKPDNCYAQYAKYPRADVVTTPDQSDF